MDEIAIDQAFLNILGVDNEVRKRSEQALASLEGRPGLYPALVAIANSAQDIKIRQSAVLFLKNSCKAWRDARRAKLNKPPIPEQDKIYLKQVILDCLKISIPDLIRLQYEEIAKILAENLFPQNWPEVFPQLDAALQSQDAGMMYAGLSLLFQLCKNYEFNMRDTRAELDLLVSRYFDHMLQCANALALSEATFPYLQLILKTYWVVTYIDVRPKLAETECFSAWLELFKKVLEMNLGSLELPPESEEVAQRREDMPAWGCKRWSAQILHRCFQRHANSTYLDLHMKQISEFFVQNFSLPITKTILGLVTLRQTRFIPNIVLNYLFKFLNQGLKVQMTAIEIKGQVSVLIADVIMPQICRVPSDEVVWRENPVEFIRKENDLGRAYYSAKSAALDLLIGLCADREVLLLFLKFLSDSLAAGASLLGKEALLLAVGSLSELIKTNVDLSRSIESMLIRYVLADLGSEVGFLRARACWTYGQFASFPLPDLDHQTQAFRQVCRLLIDPELPVKFEAALALPKLLNLPKSKELLTPEVQNVLELYLKLMDEIDSEDLVDALESLVETFNDLIIPHSVALAQKLSEAFLRLAISNTKDDEGDSAMAAVSILNIESKLLEMVQTHQSILLQMSQVLFPVLELTLSPKGCEYFEEGLNLLTCLLYYGEPDSFQHLWNLYPQLLVSITGGAGVDPYALDHLEEIFSALANFISKYKSAFLQRNGISDILKLVPYLLHLDTDSNMYQHSLAVKLLICLLENYKGGLDPDFPFILETAKVLSFEKEKDVRMLGVQLLAMCCWYNPVVALKLLGEQMQPTLHQWFQSISSFSSESGKRYMAYGLLALLLSLGVLPDSVTQQFTFLFKLVLKLLKDINDLEKDVSEPHVTDPMKPEVLYQQMLEDLRTRSLAVKREEDPDVDWGPADEDLYDSPLDSVDEVLVLRNALEGKDYTVLRVRRPTVYSQLQEGLTEKEVETLRELMNNQ